MVLIQNFRYYFFIFIEKFV